jgi:hypothetical protein
MNSPDFSSQHNNGCLIRGNPSRFMGLALVVYLDLLGMSRAIINNWGAESNSALHRLLRIKASIPRDDEKTQITLSICDPMTNKEFDSCLSITRTLSDSIVTMLALPSSPSECSSQEFSIRVFNVLFCLRSIWQQSLREGFTIRGAIELGEMFWNETEFTGPGLVCAHKLEDEFAKTSRVLVGPLLATNIVNFAKINPNTESPMNAFLIGKDEKIIVDPHFVIGPEMVNILESLQQNAGQSKNKYDEVIEILKTPKEKVRRPTIEEMSSYIKDITAELNKGDP